MGHTYNTRLINEWSWHKLKQKPWTNLGWKRKMLLKLPMTEATAKNSTKTAIRGRRIKELVRSRHFGKVQWRTKLMLKTVSNCRLKDLKQRPNNSKQLKNSTLTTGKVLVLISKSLDNQDLALLFILWEHRGVGRHMFVDQLLVWFSFLGPVSRKSRKLFGPGKP